MRDPREPIASVEDEIALFRYGLIADLLHLKPEERLLSAKLRERAERRPFECPPARLRPRGRSALAGASQNP